MNTLIEIIMNDDGIIIIRYFSDSHGKGKKIHTEFFEVCNIYRLALNGNSITIHWNESKLGLVLMIREDFDQQKIADFVNEKYPGKGLKVIEHFAKLKTMKSE